MDILEIASKIANAQGRLYLVGGAVRDQLLNINSHDKDFCVTGLTSQIFETLFPEAIKQGKNFPVYILNNCEFALARKEKKTGNKHTDFIFDTTSTISIEDDLLRRDLTINSIAIDILSNEIVDPFNGQIDLENKILRMTSPAFIEDPLRVYRVARFAAQFGFEIEKNTLLMMKSMKNMLQFLPVERVFQEFRKALSSKNPSKFFQVLKNINCLDVHFKAIFNLINVEQPLIYHPEGDAYNHTMQVLEKVSTKTSDELTRFAALVHDFGKSLTPHEDWPHHYNHDKLGISLVTNFCNNLKMPTIFLKAGCIACREHMKAGIYTTLRPGTKVDLIERCYKSHALSLKGLELLANCDTPKFPEIKFAEIGEKIMTTVSFTKEDLNELSNTDDFSKIKQRLKEKRIRALLDLEQKYRPE